MASSEPPEADVYQSTRPLLFGIAYRMLGSVSEAEDIVQEAFVRYHRAASGDDPIGSPRAYLSTITTRLAIDHLRSARVRRERYIGQWLPEPILTGDGVEALVERRESLSLALLALLERLSPLERAVFVLREVLDIDHREIARMVGRTEAHVRQMAVRARRHVQEGRPRFTTDRAARNELARRFFAALEAGDMAALISLLAADVTMSGDGGGRAPALAEPARGRERVARFLLGLARLGLRLGLGLRLTEVNTEPGALVMDPEGRVVAVMAVAVDGGSVHAIHSMVNPDKLRHLGPVVGLAELMGAGAER